MATTHEIAMAALLHDVGKVLQRAEVPLSGQARRMEQMLCPTGRWGGATHRHVLWTSDFLEGLRQQLPAGLDGPAIARLAAQHHRPTSAEEWIIAEADRLASGHDRRPDEDEGTGATFREVALQCVFSRLRLRSPEAQPSARPPVYTPRQLAAGDSLIPSTASTPAQITGAWRPLAESMATWVAGAGLGHLSPAMAIQATAGLAERLMTLVPASAMDRPDVSLYDHSAVTAAIACAIHSYHHAHGDLDEARVRDRELPKFRFVVGSLRGIQDFIFTLAPDRRRGIAKTYRARSFYVSVLTQAAILRLLDAAGLPLTNCIFSGGGRFLLLVDSSEKALESLRQAERDLQKWFVGRFLGILSLSLSTGLVVAGQELLGGAFGDVFDRIELQAEQARWQSMSAWLQDGPDWQEPHFLQVGAKADELADDLARQAVELGGALPKAAWLGLFRTDAQVRGLLREPHDCCGWQLQLGAHADGPPTSDAAWVGLLAGESAGPTWLPRHPLANYVPILNSEDLTQMACDPAAASAMRPSDPDQEPPEIGNPATFEHLALLSRRPIRNGEFTGRPLLACLRADLDRLGMLFARGFGKDTSIARTASMSRFLDLFFKDYLTARFSEPDSPFRRVYTVFAGGDDLMLIGPWHVMFHLAAELPAWLDRLTGSNPDVTLSAALALGHAKMPPSHMARDSEEQLDRAKEAGRNRVAVLNRTMSWDDFRQGLDIGRRLDAMLLSQAGSLPLPPSFVYRILQYCRSAERLTGRIAKGLDVRLPDATWRSHFLYDLERNIAPKARTDQQRADLDWLRGLLTVRLPTIPVAPIILGITYALYLHRGA